MRAAIFETPGLDNLKVIDNAEDPKMKNRDIRIKINTINFRGKLPRKLG